MHSAHIWYTEEEILPIRKKDIKVDTSVQSYRKCAWYLLDLHLHNILTGSLLRTVWVLLNPILVLNDALKNHQLCAE